MIPIRTRKAALRLARMSANSALILSVILSDIFEFELISFSNVILVLHCFAFQCAILDVPNKCLMLHNNSKVLFLSKSIKSPQFYS
jgi:hypothetical protein